MSELHSTTVPIALHVFIVVPYDLSACAVCTQCSHMQLIVLMSICLHLCVADKKF